MDDLEVATRAAGAAADLVRSAHGDRTARMKGAVDPVTEVDLAAERAIVDILRDTRPDDDILAEETGGSVGERTWVVDPLDGTVNFVQGIDHVAVSVALWERDRAVVGVIVDVFGDRTYRAVRGQGADVDGHTLAVDVVAPADAVVATGYPYDRHERSRVYGDLTARLLGSVRGVRRFGSAALDFAWVAEGRLGGYLEIGLAPWDVAAGLLLVREAGGVVLDEHGVDAGLGSRVYASGSIEVARHLVSLVAPGA
jgi:myo-inositol-1(or 4)-monophosphatase